MNTAGWSKARLGRMHEIMVGYVERGEVPGLVTLASRRARQRGGQAGTRKDTMSLTVLPTQGLFAASA